MRSEDTGRPGGTVYGRDRESRVVGGFVTGLDPTTLVVTGLSGTGKTVTVLAALDRTGVRDSVVRIVRASSSKPYAQRPAGGPRVDLSGLVTSAGPDHELDAARLLDVVTAGITASGAADGVLFIDDLKDLSPQRSAWLQQLGDLAYERGWRVIAAARRVPEGVLPDDVEVLALGPLDESALRRVLDTTLELPVAVDVASRLRWWSAGNPRLATELAEGLTAAQLRGDREWTAPEQVGPAGRRAYQVLLDGLDATEMSALAELWVDPWDPVAPGVMPHTEGGSSSVADPAAARMQQLATAHPLLPRLCREQLRGSSRAGVTAGPHEAAGPAGMVEAILDGLHLEDLAGLPADGVTPRATAGVVGVALLTGTSWVHADTGARFLNLIDPAWTDHLWWRDPTAVSEAARSAGARVAAALINLETTGRLDDPACFRADLDALAAGPDPHWVGLCIRVRGHLLLGDAVGGRKLLEDPSAKLSGRTIAEVVARDLAAARLAMTEGRPAGVRAHLMHATELRPGIEHWLPVRGMHAAASAMLDGQVPTSDLIPTGAWSTRALGEFALDLGAARLAVGHIMTAAELLTIGVERCAWPYRGRAQARADMIEAAVAAEGATGARALRLIDPPVAPEERVDGNAAAAHLRMQAILRGSDRDPVSADDWLPTSVLPVSPWQRMRSLVAYGRHCLARNDRPASARALREARSLASLAGAPGWCVGIDALLVADAPARVGWNRLNEEERVFVRLALQGWTNAQIAASVYVSVRTVANRLRQIYALLGVRDRRDLVVHAETDPPGWLKDHA